jgi:hypothetical protein
MGSIPDVSSFVLGERIEEKAHFTVPVLEKEKARSP